MECSQSYVPVKYIKGEIVKHTRYKDDKINRPLQNPSPKKYFKVIEHDEPWGTVSYRQSNRYGDVWENTIGVAYVKKTNFIGKLIWFLFWSWKK